MRRRALLSTLAATTVPIAAGCTGDGTGTPTDEAGDEPPTEPPEDTTTGSDSTPTSEPTQHSAQVSVRDVAVQRGYVVREVADAIGIRGDRNRYVWMDVSVVAGAFARDVFTLDTGHETFSPLAEPRSYRVQIGDETAYDLQSGSGLLLFELPTDIDVSPQRPVPEMFLRWPGGEHQLDQSVAERIVSKPAPLSVRLRKRYAKTPATPIAIEVENRSDEGVGRRFVGALNREGPAVTITPVQRVVADVPAGESRSVTIDDGWHDRTPVGDRGEDRPAVEYALHWAGDSAHVTFQDV